MRECLCGRVNLTEHVDICFMQRRLKVELTNLAFGKLQACPLVFNKKHKSLHASNSTIQHPADGLPCPAIPMEPCHRHCPCHPELALDIPGPQKAAGFSPAAWTHTYNSDSLLCQPANISFSINCTCGTCATFTLSAGNPVNHLEIAKFNWSKSGSLISVLIDFNSGTRTSYVLFPKPTWDWMPGPRPGFEWECVWAHVVSNEPSTVPSTGNGLHGGVPLLSHCTCGSSISCPSSACSSSRLWQGGGRHSGQKLAQNCIGWNI